MPLEEEEEGDDEDGVGGKGSSEDAGDPEQGTPAAANGGGAGGADGGASAEVRRQMCLTRDWLRMVCLHAACEVLPLFLLVTFDLPQVGLGIWWKFSLSVDRLILGGQLVNCPLISVNFSM